MIANLRWTILPYCLKKLECGRYIILNRGYKPLGFFTDDFIKYEDYPVLYKLNITAAFAKRLSCQGKSDTDQIWLYDDGCIPGTGDGHMKAYLGRLAMLSRLEIRSPIFEMNTLPSQGATCGENSKPITERN